LPDDVVLLQLDDVVRLPGLVEERLERTVEAEEREPALALLTDGNRWPLRRIERLSGPRD
jgi:hypothetical protein